MRTSFSLHTEHRSSGFGFGCCSSGSYSGVTLIKKTKLRQLARRKTGKSEASHSAGFPQRSRITIEMRNIIIWS